MAGVVLQHARGLDATALAAIAELERRVVEADGGRLKLDWEVLRSRSGERVEDLLWWDGEALTGFLGVYAFQAPVAELSGMVDPSTRRCGIGTALLDAAIPLCRERGCTTALLVTPRASEGARALALGRGARLHHSEYALELLGEPADRPTDPRLTLRAMTGADVAEAAALFSAGFGWHGSKSSDDAASDVADLARQDHSSTLVAELDGETGTSGEPAEPGGRLVAAARLVRDGENAGVYGLVVRPDLQGRGIGRDVLRRLCRLARADGASRLHLEVAVDNERALGLYTSLGFRLVTTEDYYQLPTNS